MAFSEASEPFPLAKSRSFMLSSIVRTEVVCTTWMCVQELKRLIVLVVNPDFEPSDVCKPCHICATTQVLYVYCEINLTMH
jgi:hypothetical protein